MSQRELAVAVGVAPSTVAAIESGARHPSVELLDRLLRASGLRLAVVDADGVELAPFPDEAVRDNAGRRFPAHLDVLPPDRVPPTRVASPRYDRPPEDPLREVADLAAARGHPARGVGPHPRARRRLGGCSTPLVALGPP